MIAAVNIQIRDVNEHDLEAVRALIVAHGFPISSDDMRYRYELYKKIGVGKSWVATTSEDLQNKIIGCAALVTQKSVTSGKFSARVTNLFVANEYRRLGVGNKLLDAIEHYVVKLGGSELEILLPSIEQGAETSFYLNRGYVFVADRKAFVLKIAKFEHAEHTK